jgi:hypothetical protein
MHNIVNWLPGETGLFDLMHAIFGSTSSISWIAVKFKAYIATIKHVCKNILYKNGMVNTDQSEKLTQFFKRLVWPPSISRLPPSVCAISNIFSP